MPRQHHDDLRIQEKNSDDDELYFDPYFELNYNSNDNKDDFEKEYWILMSNQAELQQDNSVNQPEQINPKINQKNRTLKKIKRKAYSLQVFRPSLNKRREKVKTFSRTISLTALWKNQKLLTKPFWTTVQLNGKKLAEPKSNNSTSTRSNWIKTVLSKNTLLTFWLQKDSNKSMISTTLILIPCNRLQNFSCPLQSIWKCISTT